MRANRIAGALVAAVVLIGVTALPAHAGREYATTYVASSALTCAFTDADLAGLCIQPMPDDNEVRVRIVDESGRKVGGVVRFYDQRRYELGEPTFFCHRTVVEIPEGARQVAIDVVAHSSVTGCDVGIATVGTIVAFFT